MLHPYIYTLPVNIYPYTNIPPCSYSPGKSPLSVNRELTPNNTPPRVDWVGDTPPSHKLLINNLKPENMAFKLTAYQRQSAELTDNGTIANLIGPKGSIAFIRKNLNDPNKRVALLLTDSKGNSGIVSCSEQVSKAVRGGDINIHQLAGLSLLENENGVTFVAMPATGAIQTISMKDIKVVSYERSEEFLPEEMLEF